jgi:hypothetical protein
MKSRILSSLFIMLVGAVSLYAQSGVQIAWKQHYGSGLFPSIDIATAVAVDDASNVYVTGYSTKPLWGANYFTAKYNASGVEVWTIKCIQTPVSVEEKTASRPTAYSLSQNHPNPLNPSTTIRYVIPKTGHVTLKELNLLGEEMSRS